MSTTHGNFCEDTDAFDHTFFRISPREARSMDPQQRLLLRNAYKALESAGYVPNATPSFNPDTFSVYVGASTDDYVQNLRNDIDVYYSTGKLYIVIVRTTYSLSQEPYRRSSAARYPMRSASAALQWFSIQHARPRSSLSTKRAAPSSTATATPRSPGA